MKNDSLKLKQVFWQWWEWASTVDWGDDDLTPPPEAQVVTLFVLAVTLGLGWIVL